MEIGKELAVCHAPPFECRCSVLYSIIIYIYCHVKYLRGKSTCLCGQKTEYLQTWVRKCSALTIFEVLPWILACCRVVALLLLCFLSSCSRCSLRSVSMQCSSGFFTWEVHLGKVPRLYNSSGMTRGISRAGLPGACNWKMSNSVKNEKFYILLKKTYWTLTTPAI